LRHDRPIGDVLEQAVDCLRCVLLVRADDPGRAALDPAGAVDPAADAATVVCDRPARLVERHSGDCDAAVADAAEDEPGWDRDLLARWDGLSVDDLVANEDDLLDAVGAPDLDRREKEAQDDAARLASRFARRELAQHLEIPLG